MRKQPEGNESSFLKSVQRYNIFLFLPNYLSKNALKGLFFHKNQSMNAYSKVIFSPSHAPLNRVLHLPTFFPES